MNTYEEVLAAVRLAVHPEEYMENDGGIEWGDGAVRVSRMAAGWCMEVELDLQGNDKLTITAKDITQYIAKWDKLEGVFFGYAP
jgi:hypothetical protein